MENKNNNLNKIQLILPSLVCAILSVLFFTDFRKIGVETSLPSSGIMIIVVIGLLSLIVWSAVNVFYLKTNLKMLFLASGITIAVFLVLDFILNGYWLLFMMGILFISIPLISSVILFYLITLILKNSKK